MHKRCRQCFFVYEIALPKPYPCLTRAQRVIVSDSEHMIEIKCCEATLIVPNEVRKNDSASCIQDI